MCKLTTPLFRGPSTCTSLLALDSVDDRKVAVHVEQTLKCITRCSVPA